MIYCVFKRYYTQK